MIQLSGIGLQYHPDLPPVLDAIDATIAAGEWICLVGANGSGKSTLARVLAGLIAPTTGSRTVVPSTRVGLVLQDPPSQLVASTVERDLAFGLESQQLSQPAMVARVGDVLRRFELEHLSTRDPHALSGGQQQRVAIAGVFACAVDVLVLDEPTSQLDGPTRSRFAQLVVELHQAGMTIVWVTQLAGELALATRVIGLDAGRIAFDGTPEQLVDDAALAADLRIGLPAAARLAHALRASGVQLPGTPLQADELVALLAPPP